MNTNTPVELLLQKIDDLSRLVEKQVVMLAKQSALILKLEAQIVVLEKRTKKKEE